MYLVETEVKTEDETEDVESAVKQENITEEDPLSDTTQTTLSSTELIKQDPLEVGPLIKKEIEDVDQIIVKEETEM